MPTNYPGNIDSFAIHTDTPLEDIAASHINNMQDSIRAIETELGANVKGIKADVKTRIGDVETDLTNTKSGYISTSGAGLSKNGNTLFIPADGVVDTMIGNRTVDSTQVPVGLIGTLTEWFSWITNRIKVITGKTNWYDTPTKSLEQLNTDKLETSEVVTSASANKLLKLDSTSKLPASITGDANTVDGYNPNTGTVASTIPVRNSSGQIPYPNGYPICNSAQGLKIIYGTTTGATNSAGGIDIVFGGTFTSVLPLSALNGDYAAIPFTITGVTNVSGTGMTVVTSVPNTNPVRINWYIVGF